MNNCEESFQKRLAQIMKERGLNQTHLQEKILEQSGKTLQRQTISLYLTGKTKPDTERLELLCRALDVSADYLLGLPDKSRKSLDEFAVLGDAITTFGQQAQEAMLLEEMAELAKEICKRWRGRDNVAEIAEEIADVELMLDQLKMILCCAGRVRAIRASKVRRLEEAIREAKGSDTSSVSRLAGDGGCHLPLEGKALEEAEG